MAGAIPSTLSAGLWDLLWLQLYQTGTTDGGNELLDLAGADVRLRDSHTDVGNSLFTDVHVSPYATFPLIFSKGPDGEANIIRDYVASSGGPATLVNSARIQNTVVYLNSLNPAYHNGDASWTAAYAPYLVNDPYIIFPDGNDADNLPEVIGDVLDAASDDHFDNIYNHNLDTKL